MVQREEHSTWRDGKTFALSARQIHIQSAAVVETAMAQKMFGILQTNQGLTV